MVVSCQQMQKAEARIFSEGAEPEPLMEKAGLGCAESIRRTFPVAGRAILYCGKGNNGGDAFVAGRWLRRWGWDVTEAFPLEESTDLARKKSRQFGETPNGKGQGALILIDGLLGIGAKGPLRGEIGKMAEELNSCRRSDRAITFAIDIPSGVDGDSGEVYGGAVMADHTLSICAPKRGIIADQAVNHVGRIHQVPLPEIPIEDGDASLRVLGPENLVDRIPRRDFDFHKGKAGRVAIVAGSKGLTGAAALAAKGALNGGAGLVTVFVPEEIYSIVATRAPVEVMVRPFRSVSEIQSQRADVFAVGPGLGTGIAPELLAFAACDTRPMVLDADMLNGLANEPDLLKKFPSGQRILTPHPGELVRLAKRKLTGDRILDTRSLAGIWGVTLLHKGARSVIATAGHEPTELNSTGRPEMASGGMGDVLTGLTAALIGQGLSTHDAASAGSWVLGRAAELCPGSVRAGKVADLLGDALGELGVRARSVS